MGAVLDAIGNKSAVKMIIEATKDCLWKEGQRLIREINLQDAEYTTQTHNLDDSFGYGVYHKGSMVYHGFVFPSKDAVKPRVWYGRKIWGRTEIDKFLRGYSPRGFISLVLYAAMPYASVLERGTGLKRKYRVISSSFNHLQDLRRSAGNAAKYITVATING